MPGQWSPAIKTLPRTQCNQLRSRAFLSLPSVLSSLPAREEPSAYPTTRGRRSPIERGSSGILARTSLESAGSRDRRGALGRGGPSMDPAEGRRAVAAEACSARTGPYVEPPKTGTFEGERDVLYSDFQARSIRGVSSAWGTFASAPESEPYKCIATTEATLTSRRALHSISTLEGRVLTRAFE